MKYLDAKVVLAFVAGFFAYQAVMFVWHLLLPVVLVAGGAWLISRYLWPKPKREVE